MKVEVLGSLRARHLGSDVTPRPAKQRQVLALLALHAGTPVSLSTLVEELWGDRPPSSARTTLQTYVMHVRRGFAAAHAPDGGRSILATVGVEAYRLDVDPLNVDAHAFDLAVSTAERLAGDDRPHEAAATFDAALGLWRGEMLADLSVGEPLALQVARYEEARLSALEGRIEVQLGLGNHRAVLRELAMLSAKHKFHEGFQAQYMTALYRAGRQSQAHDVYRRLVRELRDELGADPSARLRRLHQDILKGCPTLEGAGPDGRGPSGRRAASLQVA